MVTTRALLDALALEAVAPARFRGGHADLGHGVVSGGQLLGQSLVAASVGQAGKLPKTIHTVFARPVSADRPVEIDVEPIHGGRTFASSTVTVSQHERVCAKSVVLLTGQVSVADGVDLADPDSVGPPDVDVWVRFPGAANEPVIDQALLAFSTDFFLIGTAMRPHRGVGQAQAHHTLSTGVISHTLTFHDAAPAREWTLLQHHSTFAGRGRAYGRGDVYRADGALVASFVQDAMIRAMPTAGGSHL